MEDMIVETWKAWSGEFGDALQGHHRSRWEQYLQTVHLEAIDVKAVKLEGVTLEAVDLEVSAIEV